MYSTVCDYVTGQRDITALAPCLPLFLFEPGTQFLYFFHFGLPLQLITMSFESTMNPNDVLLASALSLFSISEETTSPLEAGEAGYGSRYSSLNSDSIHRTNWGNSLTRQSYKNDLCSLAGESSQVSSSAIYQASCNSNSEAYGFFVEACRS